MRVRVSLSSPWTHIAGLRNLRADFLRKASRVGSSRRCFLCTYGRKSKSALLRYSVLRTTPFRFLNGLFCANTMVSSFPFLSFVFPEAVLPWRNIASFSFCFAFASRNNRCLSWCWAFKYLSMKTKHGQWDRAISKQKSANKRSQGSFDSLWIHASNFKI